MLHRLALALVLGAPSSLHAQDDELARTVDAVVADAATSEAFVGLSVAIGVGDRVAYAQGYGLAEVEHAVRANADTIFRIGSITKQFTGAAICRLAERGALAYEDELADYYPDFPTQGRSVTLRHLLTHTSGIQSYTNLGAEWQRTVPLELTAEELLALVKDKPFDFEPGTRFLYNNTGYFLLGVVVERISGSSYAEYVRTEFCEPLGLTRTRYGSNTDVILNRAQGYQMRGGELANDDLIGMSQPYAAGSLVSTARDLVAWSIALASGRVVSPESYEEMTTPYLFEDATDASYGFGLFLRPYNDRPCISHGGGINGFNSMLRHYPEDGLTIAVISNCEAFDSDDVAQRLANALLD